jgi:hypothetical protein
MLFRGLIASSVVVFALAVAINGSSVEGAKDKEPLAIKAIMKKAHTPAKKGEATLRDKVISGKATDDEKKELIALYTDLAANKCPKGDADDWKTRTAAILKAAKADDGKELKKASDCKGCHSMHK